MSAVGVVAEVGEYQTERMAIASVADKLGIGSTESCELDPVG
ncbi:hypothetical protein AB0B25_26675 [Nocardia sp. NPDC049190]